MLLVWYGWAPGYNSTWKAIAVPDVEDVKTFYAAVRLSCNESVWLVPGTLTQD